MEGLLSFLLFAGLFFLMMRFGCGAHMSHTNHAQQADDKRHTPPAGRHIDPVCGMAVAASEGYGMMHQGQLYRFCSRDCLDRFEADPRAFLQQPGSADASKGDNHG